MMSKENEQFEEDLTNARNMMAEDGKSRDKLERVLKDTAASLKQALNVITFFMIVLLFCLPIDI